jgi:hypothetical protein
MDVAIGNGRLITDARSNASDVGAMSLDSFYLQFIDKPEMGKCASTW